MNVKGKLGLNLRDFSSEIDKTNDRVFYTNDNENGRIKRRDIEKLPTN